MSRRVRNSNFTDPSPNAEQSRRIRAQVNVFMNQLPSDQEAATFDEIRLALPPPDRNAPDGVIHQALIDAGFGDDVES